MRLLFPVLLFLSALLPSLRAAAVEEAYSSATVWNGVTVDDSGRVFVIFPRMEGGEGVRLAELGPGGAPRAYPDAAWNAWKPGDDPAKAFVHVNAARIGPHGELWVVDTGTPGFGAAVVPGGAKVVVIDVAKNRVIRVYPLGKEAVGPHGYADDIRFHGSVAYLTDAGVPGLVVLDLKTGKTRRVLDRAPSTTARRAMTGEGKPLQTADGKEVRIHADQLEVSPDGEWLYFQAACGPLYRLATRYLDDVFLDARALEAHVEKWVDTPATGGTAIDAAGNLYVSDVDRQRVLKIDPQGRVTTLLEDPRLLWVDAMWIDNRGFLWMPAAQINRLAPFQAGTDRVERPLRLFKAQIGARPSR
ncbi:MAG: L-dopachrome tautomerase-related protein [Verrucomicrobium sp.]|nr:L-dopachrome tautomerase-related protein [Verrucomicrobium sp.]